VGVARVEIKKGEEVTCPAGHTFKARSDIPVGHKIALCDIPAGETIIKYGEAIGQAKVPIKRGEWVHTHNMG